MAHPFESEILPLNQTSANESFQISKNIPSISPELQAVMQHIVKDVVEGLGCVGAMVATLEMGNALPVRAYSVDIAPVLLRQLENRLGVSFIGPKSVAYLNDKRFKDNLSVRAVKGTNGHPEIVVSNELHDLFRPVVNKPLSKLAQRVTGIKQVIAVPFFLEDDVVGNLFAATREEFSARDKKFLIALGHQAATAIQSQRRLAETQALERVILALQANIINEIQVLQKIVDAVVQELGYVGAMVATLEMGNALPVRAYSVDIAPVLLRQLENRLGVSFIGPKSVAYLNDKRFKDNLSVRAVKGTNGHPEIVVSNELHDLFRPVVNKPLSKLAQRVTGIKQVIAVPFFLEDDVVGNLFVATRRAKFSEKDKQLLKAFGQQAAAGIRNARLYRKSEERRETAMIFAKMAFFANTAIHDLNNAVGLINTDMHLIEPSLDFEQDTVKSMEADIESALTLIQGLAEPFRDIPDEPVDIYQAIKRAARKVRILGTVNIDRCETNLPKIIGSYPVLSEIFRIFFKNGLEAMQEVNSRGGLVVSSKYDKDENKIIVIIQDTGVGIPDEHLPHIFDFRWTTKEARGGLGFGLFWAKDTIENLGGSIEVSSAVGQGTTFCILLPVKDTSQKF